MTLMPVIKGWCLDVQGVCVTSVDEEVELVVQVHVEVRVEKGKGQEVEVEGGKGVELGLWRNVFSKQWERKESEAYVFPFCGPTPAPTTPIGSESATELFKRFFKDDVCDLLVTETNRYAAQQRQRAPTSGRPWQDVSVEEVKAFVRMQILMGICKLPRIDMYWSMHHLLTPGLSSIMSLIRFKQIWRFLHLNDSVPHGQPAWDPLFKLQKLLDQAQINNPGFS